MYKAKTKSGYGCSSTFYILSCGQKGFKEFDSKWAADIAHKNQSFLSEHNLAPYVYSEVGKIRKKGNKLSGWGYITELAELLCCPGNDCDCCDRYEIEDSIEDEMNSLLDEMGECDFSFGDNHAGNVGYVTRCGEKILVCIDTGDESVVNYADDCTCIFCRNGGNCHA
jgi:hypothetical protein